MLILLFYATLVPKYTFRLNYIPGLSREEGPILVTIYTQPGCQPCKAVERQLQVQDIEYQKKDITTDQEAYDTLKHSGFVGTPVLEYRGKLSDITGLRAIIADHK